ncbi:hypothetical protein HG531_003023 [Fusarium graminearum]|nr:hypothetical protein HG531_003023 [Fusarium graminearum]
MSARLNNQHDLLAAENAAHRVHATRDGLSKSDKVGLDVGPFRAKHASSSSNTSLNLVANEQNIVLGAESLDLGEVIIVGDNNTSLTLNRLADESSGLLAVGLENLFEIGNVVVSDGLSGGGVDGTDVGNIRAVVLS